MHEMPDGLPLLYDLAAERATLGAILTDRDAIVAVAPWLRAAHFHLEKHAQVYAAALACYERRVPPDLVTVGGELNRRNELVGVGGQAGLYALMEAVPRVYHVEYYGRLVEAAAVRRRLDEASARVKVLAYDPDPELTAERRLELAAEAVLGVAAERQVGGGFVTMHDAASEYLAYAEQMPDDEDGLLGLATPFPLLNYITKGMKGGELIILAARPGMGKTALALQLAEFVARELGVEVGLFSMEMDRQLLVNRLVSQRLGVDSTRVPFLVKRGDLRAIDALAQVSRLPIHIDHTPALTAAAIRDRAQRLAADHPIGLWVVDYLQLGRSGKDRDDEVQQVTAVSQALTTLARSTRTPVLALSQLNRAVEGRAGHRPQMSDLRGSGSIEQDASQIWFIHREDKYDPETDKKGVAEIYVEKHRNGDTGICPLYFHDQSTRFAPLERYRGAEGYDHARAAD